jgi:fructose-bisphosphate aldolase class II
MEMFQALVAAANERRSPVLLQSSAQAVDYAGADYLVALARVAARNAEVPVAHHLDHGFTPEVCKLAVDAGFTSVMIDASRFPFEENVAITRDVVEYARARGVVVEGELGSPEEGGEHTDPARAVEFVERTGVDSLAVVIGNVHSQMTLDRTPAIDLDLLDAIHDALPSTPLVLHALTVIPPSVRAGFLEAGGDLPAAQTVGDDVYRAVARHPGVVKLNTGASLKMAAVAAMRRTLDENRGDIDPRHVWGAARESLIDVVTAHLDRLGSSGAADRSE